ncbi:hypothetical protein [Cellulomonas sp. URHB0016]
MDTSSTLTADAVEAAFTSANPFLGETETLVVAGHVMSGQRPLNEVPTQRSHG